MIGTNVRLVNSFGEVGGRWFVEPADWPRMRKFITGWLVAARDAEPASDWHLETRGTVATWHRWAN